MSRSALPCLSHCYATAAVRLLALALLLALSLTPYGCGAPEGVPPGAVVGRADRYDYSPSVMQNGSELQIWWCGMARNPTDSSQDSDSILYATVNTTTGRKSHPKVVLAETKNAWDSAFTCNPRVIRGRFANPLSDGVTYSYAMYYVATSASSGTGNSIGVAFSNDGVHWKKYRDPIILPAATDSYGVGQPAAYNLDGKSSLILLYEEINNSIEHVEAVSTDGVHFTVQGKLTRAGLDPNNSDPSWGDIAYEPDTRYWYAAFNLGIRPATSTGDKPELGQYGIQLYRIPNTSLLTGEQPWQLLKTFDTNTTGYEVNFIAGIQKDLYGNLSVGPQSKIQLYPSIANPTPGWDDSPKARGTAGDIIHWDIGSVSWTPGEPTLALIRYKNKDSYTTTTGYLDPRAEFKSNATLGHLYAGIQDGATTAFYDCRQESTDYFVSLDPLCNGNYIVGLEGYGYAQPAPDQATVPIYSCSSSALGHFASNDAQCEGSGAGTLLGYALR